MNELLIQAIDEALKNKKIVKVLKMSKCKLTDDLFAKLLLVIEESRYKDKFYFKYYSIASIIQYIN